MPAKIRLQRHGRKKRPFYHIVVADARAPRDGKFIEKIGTYNPMTSPATIDLDRDKAFDWLMKGAQPTYTMAAILRFKGVMFRKHLQRGVAKGAISQEQADAKYNQFIEDKDAKIATRFEKSAQEKIDRLKAIDGIPGKSKVVVVDAVAAADAFKTEGTDTRSLADQVEQTTIDSVVAEAPAAEVVEAPAVVAEAPAPEVKEEAPAPEVKEEATAPEVKEEAPAPVAEAPAAGPDVYKKIEGIGPKIEELLHNAGLATYADLAEAPVDKLKGILAEAGSRYTMHDPTTWPQQSKLAADGKWDELKTLQDELDGGKPPVA